MDDATKRQTKARPLAEIRLVAEGVGLPRYYLYVEYGPPREEVVGFRGVVHDRRGYDTPDRLLADYQTAQGCLRQLAMWAGDDGKAQAYWLTARGDYGWALMSEAGREIAIFQDVPKPSIDRYYTVPGLACSNPAEALAAILTHIGMDHAIRRALGWAVEPETLATLMWSVDHWLVEHGDEHVRFSAIPRTGAICAPALAGVTDPAEAWRAIYEEVAP
jgi:hypothetical protein